MSDEYSDTYSDTYEDAGVPPPPVFNPPPASTELGAQRLQFYVCNSRTGAILGRISPNRWEITETLRETSTATVHVPLPADTTDRDTLRDLIKPAGLRSFDRTICLEDNGTILFSGPIISRPVKDGGEVVIPVVDWRSWFYACPIRPTGATFTTRRNYTATNREQGLIMTDLAAIALEATSGDPPIIIDTAPTTGVTRNLTAKMFQGNSVGEWLDGIMNSDRGCEWYTYSILSADGMTILPHFAVAFPERSSSFTPLRITYRQGEFGNASGYTWPQPTVAPTRVWAYDGGDDTKLWSQATSPTVAAGVDLLWETSVTLDDSATKKADAFNRAKGELALQTGSDGLINITVINENLPFGSYSVGDRVRLLVKDDWESINSNASRIVQRVLSGGAGEATQQVLTIDLNDGRYPKGGPTPGSAVTGG